jgi:hypothetical protein
VCSFVVSLSSCYNATVCRKFKAQCVFPSKMENATFMWFVVYKGLHPDWNKWMFVVAMMAIDMCIGR